MEVKSGTYQKTQEEKKQELMDAIADLTSPNVKSMANHCDETTRAIVAVLTCSGMSSEGTEEILSQVQTAYIPQSVQKEENPQITGDVLRKSIINYIYERINDKHSLSAEEIASFADMIRTLVLY